MPLSHPLKLLQTGMACIALLLLGSHEGLAQTGVDPVAGDDATVVAFVNVAVVSMQDETLLHEQTFVIDGDRILSIGSVDSLSVPVGATVIDGSGQYLIPGLADMHVYIQAPFADGPLYLNDGITTVLSLGTKANTLSEIIQERDRSRTPHFMGPSFYSVGPWIRGRDSDTPDEDLAHIEEYLYASFNPGNAGFKVAVYTSLLVLFLSLIKNASWLLGALNDRIGKRPSSESSTWSRPVRRWIHVFAGASWLFFIVLFLSVTEPFAGIHAGSSATAQAPPAKPRQRHQKVVSFRQRWRVLLPHPPYEHAARPSAA